MNAASAFLQNEPVWLSAGIVAALTLAAHYGFHLSADEIVALNVLATLALAAATRANTVPFAKFLALAYPVAAVSAAAAPPATPSAPPAAPPSTSSQLGG